MGKHDQSLGSLLNGLPKEHRHKGGHQQGDEAYCSTLIKKDNRDGSQKWSNPFIEQTFFFHSIFSSISHLTAAAQPRSKSLPGDRAHAGKSGPQNLLSYELRFPIDVAVGDLNLFKATCFRLPGKERQPSSVS